MTVSTKADIRTRIRSIAVLCALSLLGLVASAQSLSKEFIYLGDRLIAVDNAAVASQLALLPNGGIGGAQTYSVSVPFQHVNPATNASSPLHFVFTYISASYGTISGPPGCQVVADYTGGLYLVGTSAWLGPLTPGSARGAVNDVCFLDAKQSTFSNAGGTVSMNLAISFLPRFEDNRDDTGQPMSYKNIWLASLYQDGHFAEGTPYVWRGTYNLSPAPMVFSASPSSGSGARTGCTIQGGQGITCTFFVAARSWVPNTTLTQVYFSIGEFYQPVRCQVIIGPGENPKKMWLLADDGVNWMAHVLLGTADSRENTRCKLRGQNSWYITDPADGSVRAEIDLEFKPGFTGLKNIYMNGQVSNGQYYDWIQRGTWTTP